MQIIYIFFKYVKVFKWLIVSKVKLAAGKKIWKEAYFNNKFCEGSFLNAKGFVNGSA